MSAFAIGLLVTHRMSQAHSRYMEARSFWGQTINLTRNLSSRTLAWHPGLPEEIDTKLKLIRPPGWPASLSAARQDILPHPKVSPYNRRV